MWCTQSRMTGDHCAHWHFMNDAVTLVVLQTTMESSQSTFLLIDRQMTASETSAWHKCYFLKIHRLKVLSCWVRANNTKQKKKKKTAAAGLIASSARPVHNTNKSQSKLHHQKKATWPALIICFNPEELSVRIKDQTPVNKRKYPQDV